MLKRVLAAGEFRLVIVHAGAPMPAQDAADWQRLLESRSPLRVCAARGAAGSGISASPGPGAAAAVQPMRALDALLCSAGADSDGSGLPLRLFRLGYHRHGAAPLSASASPAPLDAAPRKQVEVGGERVALLGDASFREAPDARRARADENEPLSRDARWDAFEPARAVVAAELLPLDWPVDAAPPLAVAHLFAAARSQHAASDLSLTVHAYLCAVSLADGLPPDFLSRASCGAVQHLHALAAATLPPAAAAEADEELRLPLPLSVVLNMRAVLNTALAAQAEDATALAE
jgi:hypothetical protein